MFSEMGLLPKAHVLPYSQDVADLFDPSVQAIINAFEQQKRAASIPIDVSILFITYR